MNKEQSNQAIGSSRVLVTGAAGFLGARIAKRVVDEKCDVHVVVRDQTDVGRLEAIESMLTIHRADLADDKTFSSLLERIRPDFVFHSAASGEHSATEGRRNVFRNNVVVAQYMIEAISATSGCTVISLSGSLSYGPQTKPIDEATPFNPVTTYGAAKAAASIIIMQAARSDALPVIELRPFSIYGYGEKQKRFIPSAIRAAFDGTILPLTPPGFVHDFVFVDDVVDACVLAAERRDLFGEVFNIGSGLETANERVVELIEELTGKKIHVRLRGFMLRANDSHRWCAEPRKAVELLGWRPRHSLADGLKKMIEHYA